MTEIDEIVEVGCIFKRGAVQPVWMGWRGRRVPIERVTYHWQDTRGEVGVSLLTVTNGTDVFELEFNSKTLVWRLRKVYTD